MIKVEEHLRKIEKVKEELSRCKVGTPHYRDVRKHLHRLTNEYRTAARYLNGK